MGFSFERMTRSFEVIQADFDCNRAQLPTTKHFIEAMAEVNALFETLGTAFTFVKRDIEKKVAIIHRHASHDPTNFSDLNKAIDFEITNRCFEAPHVDGLPNCSRTLLRLMWALRFADCLLEGIGQTLDPRSPLRYSDRTLRWAVARAYDATLAENHSWTVRRSVKGACLLLPTKESFLDRLGVEHHKREDYIRRLAASMSPLVQRMYTLYERNNLLKLP